MPLLAYIIVLEFVDNKVHYLKWNGNKNVTESQQQNVMLLIGDGQVLSASHTIAHFKRTLFSFNFLFAQRETLQYNSLESKSFNPIWFSQRLATHNF